MVVAFAFGETKRIETKANNTKNNFSKKIRIILNVIDLVFVCQVLFWIKAASEVVDSF